MCIAVLLGWSVELYGLLNGVPALHEELFGTRFALLLHS